MKRSAAFLLAILMVFSILPFSALFISAEVTTTGDDLAANWTCLAIKYSQRSEKYLPATINSPLFKFDEQTDGSIKVDIPTPKELTGAYAVSFMESKHKTTLDDLTVTLKPDNFDFSSDDAYQSRNLSVVFTGSEISGIVDLDKTPVGGISYAYFVYLNGLRNIMPAGSKGVCVNLQTHYEAPEYNSPQTASIVQITYFDGNVMNDNSDVGFRWTFVGVGEEITGHRDTYGRNIPYPQIYTGDGVTIAFRPDTTLGYIISINGKDFYSENEIGYFPGVSGKVPPTPSSLGEGLYDIDLTDMVGVEGCLGIGSGSNRDNVNTNADYTVVSINGVPAAKWAGEANTHKHTPGEEFDALTVTCIKAGSKQIKCTECNAILSETPIAPLAPDTGHSFGEWETVTAPTCTSQGSKARTCTTCGEIENSVIPITHTYGEWEIVTPASCFTNGRKKHTCELCGNVEYDYIPAEHTYGEWETVTPCTCTENGTKNRVCELCGHEDIGIIPAAHTYGEWEIVTPAECTESGVKSHTCEVCGETESESIPALGHDYTLTQEVKPTCTEAGSNTYTCNICGNIKIEEIAATGHKYLYTYIPSTCTTDGYVKTTCADCDYEATEVYKATGHSVLDGSKATVDPTCTEQGYASWICKTCGEEIHEAFVAPLGHNIEKWELTTPAMFTAPGVEEGKCTVCRETFTREIPKLENKYTDLPEGEWYTEACLWCADMSYMSGTGSTKFSPADMLTRAQFVQVIAKVEGVDLKAIEYKAVFSDVAEDKWYTNAVIWASDFGVTGGMGDGTFTPNAPVSRQQLAVFLRTYAAKKNIDTSKKEELSVYDDHTSIAAWAIDAMAWAVNIGLISGTDSTHISPLTTATRAQVAVIIRNFQTKVK